MKINRHPSPSIAATGNVPAPECFSTIVEHSSDAIIISDADKILTNWNKGAEIMLGYTKDEAIGKTAHRLGIIRFSVEEMTEIDNELCTAGVWKAQKYLYHKNGSRIPCEVSAHALFSNVGAVSSSVFIIRDISRQKELENQLRRQQSMLEEKVQEKTLALLKRERRFRAMTEYNNDITLLLDKDLTIIYASPSTFRITGWTNTEINNLDTLAQYVHPDDRITTEHIVRSLLLQPGTAINASFRYKTKSGEYLYFEMTVTNLLQEENITAVIFNARNVTERKRNEGALSEQKHILAEKEKLLDLYARHSPAAIAMFDRNMCYQVVSDRWIETFGTEGVDVIGQSHYDVFPDLTEDWKEVHRMGMNGITTRREEDKFLRSDGKVQWLRWEVRPWYDAGGAVGGILIFSEDITIRKEAESVMAKREEQYRSLVESISDGFIALDKNWHFTYINKVAATLFGRPADYLLGKDIWAEYPASVGKSFHNAYRKAMRTQKPIHLEEYSFAINRWVDVDIYPSPAGLSIFFRDKTEQKKAEENARKSEETRLQIMQSALDAIICTNRNGNIILWNNNASQLFGWKEEDILGHNIADSIIPDRYRTFHKEGMKRYLESGKGPMLNKLIEISAVNKDGLEFPIEIFIASIGQGDEMFFCSFIRDISKRKKAEEEVSISQRRLEQAQEIARLGHWETDLVNDKSHWSDEAYHIYGIEPGDHNISEAEWLSYIHPDDRNRVISEMIKSRACLDKSAFYHRIVLKDGTVRHVYSESRYEFDKDGNPIRHHGIVHDITNLKKLEYELQEQQRLEQQKLTAIALEAQEKERNAIGIELHDNVNQLITGSKMILSMAKSRTDDAGEYIQAAIEGLEEAIHENRKIAHELVAPDFEAIELGEQLNSLSNSMLVPAGLQVNINTTGLDESVTDVNHKLTLYRIAQEQCTNIIKYAQARNVIIAVCNNDIQLRMVISDDGVGKPADQPTEGIGLRNIKSRLSIYNGSVNIITAPGRGFTLEVVIPL